MADASKPSSLLISLSLFLTLSAATTNGLFLKLPLLHKHHPYPNPTPPSHILTHDSTRISLLRRRRQTIKSPVTSAASSGTGQYLVSLHLGTPPQRLLLVADTGSDLIWVRCSACRNCSRHLPDTSFLPRHSTSFGLHHCYDRACTQVPHPARGKTCNHKSRVHTPCPYSYTYSDGSITAGLFGTETTSLNTSSNHVKRLKNVGFGCGFRVSGPSVTGPSFNGAQGVLGLGQGPISFSSQLGRRFGNKFSYCLMDYTLSPPPTSYLIIGAAQNDTVSKMSFTPLLTNPLSPTFYYMGIKNAFVDGVKLPISPSVWSLDRNGNGGTIIDSGTTLTFFVDPAYREILAAFRRRVKLPSPSESTPGFDLCLNVSGVVGKRASLPSLSFEMEGGAVFSPPERNYFIDTSEDVKCLAIRRVDSAGGNGLSVIGNLMQQGYLLEFDRERSRIGFSRRGCALS